MTELLRREFLAGFVGVAGQLRKPPDAPKGEPDAFDRAKWERLSGAPLDLSGMKPTFESRFAPGSIVPGDSRKPAQWYAGAQGGPYGLANVGYGVGSAVYRPLSGGGLVIRANRTPGAKPDVVGGWYSGHLQTVNIHGDGFAQSYGYFEARMKFPLSYMAWPAFWLKHRAKWTNRDAVNIELDVIEWYGINDRQNHHRAVHLGPGPGIRRRHHPDIERRSEDLTTDFHTYGVLLDRDWMTIYFDRKAVSRHPMLEEFRQPLYPQVTLSVNGHRNELPHAAEALDPMELQIEYVRVWSAPAV